MDMFDQPKADDDNANADDSVPAPVTDMNVNSTMAIDRRNDEEENKFQNVADDDDNDQHQPSTATWNAAAVVYEFRPRPPRTVCRYCLMIMVAMIVFYYHLI